MKKTSCCSAAGNWLLFLVTVAAVFAAYTACSALWVDVGGLDLQDRHLVMFEPLFVGILSSLFFFHKIRSRLSRYFLPLIPALIFYSSFDLFYSFLKRSPHPSDLRNISTIADFSPWFAMAAIIWLLIIPAASLFFLLWQAIKKYSSGEILLSLFYRGFIFCSLFLALFSDAFINIYLKKFNYIDWSQERTIRSNGRFSSFIYYGMQEKQNKVALNNFSRNFLSRSININHVLYPEPELIKKRNIHIVVLESFLDPRLIENASFSRSPLSAELIPFMLDGAKFSMVTSPVYGGRTAQAEFELLAGMQALSKIDSIEFNVMMGKPASSLIKRLTECDYQAVATIASSSGYFNSKQAYRSLGFNKVTFLKDMERFHEPEWMPIFDSDVFQYHLNLIEEMIKSKEKPVVSYVLGMFGHFPYETDQQKQPDVIKVKHEDDRVQKIANQFFYRTKAVAEHIKKLLAIDPDSVIYITSDHLPPILWDGTKYKFDQQINVALLIDAGKTVDISGSKYFQIPWIIWDNLTGKKHDRQIDDPEMENLYFKFLSESICGQQ